MLFKSNLKTAFTTVLTSILILDSSWGIVQMPVFTPGVAVIVDVDDA